MLVLPHIVNQTTLHHLDPMTLTLRVRGSFRVKKGAVLPIFDPDQRIDPRVI